MTANPLEYFKVAVKKTYQARKYTRAAKFVEARRGKAVSFKALANAMGRIVTATCSSSCYLQEVLN